MEKENKVSKPPKFKEALDNIPESVRDKFESDLHGKLVGIWPINKDRLL